MERRVNDWSLLGFGCLRFPKKGNAIDLEETEKELKWAIEHGVNYLDTAYIYKGSEKVLGQLLTKNNWRAQVVIATKAPHYMIRSIAGLEKIFNEQLERLQTDYVDNYLIHMLPDVDIWDKLVRMGILDWIDEKKRSGKIRKIGFSYHGNSQKFMDLLDVYDWEFCQVQYNYMDEFSQAGRAGIKKAAKKGIPVIIMEPLRGGRLVDGLPEEAKNCFKQADSRKTPAEWGLRWLWNQPEIAVVLSGMNTMEMVKENINIAESVKVHELTEADMQVYEKVKEAISAKIKVPCTGCGYCQPCPKGVDIPGAFRCLNVRFTDGFYKGMKEYLMCTTFSAIRTNASLCVGCGKCEQHCPQDIKIRKELKQVVHYLENPVYQVLAMGSKFIFKK